MTLDRARYRGSLLGLAAGDAVGTTVEFSRPGTFPPLTDMVGGGPFRLRPGEWTDDTSMALCLAESLLQTGRNDPADQLARYLRWRDDGHLSSTGACFDIGNTTSNALERYRRTGAVIDALVDPDAAANGSLMRLAPVPLRYARAIETAIAEAAASSRTTHPAERPVDACRYYAALIAGAVRGVAKDELLAPGYWRWGQLHPAIAAVAAGSFRTKSPPAIRGTGYVVDCLEAALWAFANTDDFAAGALAAANLGDDADTTAAVYGQLAGAVYGEAGIPAAWRARLALRDVIEGLADGLYAAAVGLPEHPDCYWVRPGRLLAGEYPGALDAEQAAGKLAALRRLGVTAFVDLTEAGELRPYVPLAGAHHRRPIRDLDVPSDAELVATLDLLDALLDAGETVYLHCWGGVGRTGTVAACHLVRHGEPPPTAIDALARLRAGSRKHRRPSPETAVQIALVQRWRA